MDSVDSKRENTAIAAYNAAVLGLANQLGSCKCNLGYCRAGASGSGRLEKEIGLIGLVGVAVGLEIFG